MEKKLKVLILEDVASDAELMLYELSEAGMQFNSECASDKESFIRALEESPPDIILCDYSLPSFDGLSAMKISLEKYPDVPFIFVSGALGEERAIELLKEGATDYVLKHRLSRLAPAVARALNEAQARINQKKMEAALRESEIRYRTIFENTGTATIIFDANNTILLANRQFEKMSGYSISEIQGKKGWLDFVMPDDLASIKSFNRQDRSENNKSSEEHEFRLLNRNHEVRTVLATSSLIPSTGTTVMSMLDITERKAAQEALKKREQELNFKSTSLEEANTALKVLLKHREEDKMHLEEQVLSNVKKLVFPYIENLKRLNLNEDQMTNVKTIETHLNDIVSPFLRNLTSAYLGLTPREIQVANFVREGKTTKEIIELLNISATAIDFHRKNLRSKLGIKNKKTNLRAYLSSLS